MKTLLWSSKFWLLSIISFLNSSEGIYGNYPDYDTYVYDLCSNPDEAHVTTGECSHEEFFSSSNITKIKEIEKFNDSKMRFCCNEHEYVFKDYCEERDTYNKYVCAPQDFTSFAGRQDPLKCPKCCREYRQVAFKDLEGNNLFYDGGKVVFKNTSLHPNTKSLKIVDTCLTYMCKPDKKWTVGVEVCVCHEEKPTKDIDEKTFGKNYKRCCENAEIMKFDPLHKSFKCKNKIDPNEPTRSMTCSKPLRKVNVFGYGMKEEQHHYRGKLSDDGNDLKVSFDASLGARGMHTRKQKKVPLKFKDYCVGWKLNRNTRDQSLELSFGPYFPILVYCEPKLTEFYQNEGAFQTQKVTEPKVRTNIQEPVV